MSWEQEDREFVKQLKTLRVEQAANPRMNELLQRCKEATNGVIELHNQKFTIINDMLCSQNENYQQWRILVPKASLEMVIKHFHERRAWSFWRIQDLQTSC
jgi:hypothetical protein